VTTRTKGHEPTPPKSISSLTRAARTPNLSIVRSYGVSTVEISYDFYSFHYVPEPTNFIGRIGDRSFDCREQLPPWIMPLEPGTPHNGDREGEIDKPVFSAGIPRSYLDRIAEDMFDVGKISLEPRRFIAAPGFSELIARFVGEASSETAEAKFAADNLSALIVVDFLRAVWPGSRRSGPLAEGRHQGVAKARKVILRDYASQFSVKELAGLANLSTAQFMVRFKRDTGETPHEMLRRVRVEAAKRALERGLGVIDAGFSVGFQSASGFRSAFYTLVGTSPDEYRSEFRK
jgi:AraC-like DNA-binding protein